MKIDQKENISNTMIISFMASAKQIAWRKKFARMSKAGKFKKKSKVRKPDGSRQSDFIPQYEFEEARRKKAGKPSMFASDFSLAEYEKNEDVNNHGENARQLVVKFGTDAELKKIEAINKRHHQRKYLSREDGKKRYAISQKYYKKLVAESKK
jgi:hypothetical protein